LKTIETTKLPLSQLQCNSL